MASLNIRNLPDDVHAALRVRAARAGRSMESEVRHILTAACMGSEETLDADDLVAWVDKLYGDSKPSGVVDGLIADRRKEANEE